jgi:hypothetical protein
MALPTSEAINMLVNATAAPTERSMPPERMTKVGANRGDAKKCVISHEIYGHAQRTEVRKRHAADRVVTIARYEVLAGSPRRFKQA